MKTFLKAIWKSNILAVDLEDNREYFNVVNIPLEYTFWTVKDRQSYSRKMFDSLLYLALKIRQVLKQLKILSKEIMIQLVGQTNRVTSCVRYA